MSDNECILFQIQYRSSPDTLIKTQIMLKHSIIVDMTRFRLFLAQWEGAEGVAEERERNARIDILREWMVMNLGGEKDREQSSESRVSLGGITLFPESEKAKQIRLNWLVLILIRHQLLITLSSCIIPEQNQCIINVPKRYHYFSQLITDQLHLIINCMNQKRFRVERFIVLLLMIDPYRDQIKLSHFYYYSLIIVLFALKLYKEKANPKTLLLIPAFISSIGTIYYPRLYFITAVFCFTSLFYPWKLYLLPVMEVVSGYKKLRIPGEYNSDARVFYPSETGDQILIDWLLDETYQKLHTNRRNTFKLPFFLFKFIFSYLSTYKFRVRNGEVAKHKGVIIFSHGAGGFLHVYSNFLRLLAKQYVVVTIQHVETPLNMNQEGKELDERRQELERRSLAILQTLNYFKNTKEIANLLGSQYNASSFYLMGHSYGGATVLNTNFITNIKDQVDGLILLDPWLRPIRPQRLSFPIQVNTIIIPFQMYWVDENIRDYIKRVVVSNRGNPKCQEIIVKNGYHMDITDIVYVIGNLIPKGYNKGHQETVKVVLELISSFITKGQVRKEKFWDKVVDNPYY